MDHGWISRDAAGYFSRDVCGAGALEEVCGDIAAGERLTAARRHSPCFNLSSKVRMKRICILFLSIVAVVFSVVAAEPEKLKIAPEKIAEIEKTLRLVGMEKLLLQMK